MLQRPGIRGVRLVQLGARRYDRSTSATNQYRVLEFANLNLDKNLLNDSIFNILSLRFHSYWSWKAGKMKGKLDPSRYTIR